MITRVVNIHDSSYDIYVGRSGHGLASLLGNPFPLKIHTIAARAEALERYDVYFQAQLSDASLIAVAFRRELERCRGKVLGCFCQPRGGFRGAYYCHAQRIAAHLNGCTPQEIP
ncbi:MAG: DUF4326 domain-containing protein [Dehalococcoidia bacterium]|nr:DUF4326 domain-containing protein [Dehalococcoidia bacterium]